MYCPRCSQAQASNQMRYCSRCGFSLDAVKDLIEPEGEAGQPRRQSKLESILPLQRDISTGALFMFIGGIVALLWGSLFATGPDSVVLPQAYLILGFTLGFILLLLHPLLRALEGAFSKGEESPLRRSKRRDGINLGAVLMFLGTLKAGVLSNLLSGSGRWGTTFIMMSGMLVLLMVSRWLVGGVYRLFFREPANREGEGGSNTAASEKTLGDARGPAGALPPAHGLMVNDIIHSGVKTAEVAAPPSVTEHTTKVLDDD